MAHVAPPRPADRAGPAHLAMAASDAAAASGGYRALRPPGGRTAASLDGRDGVRGRQAGRASVADFATGRCGTDRTASARPPATGCAVAASRARAASTRPPSCSNPRSSASTAGAVPAARRDRRNTGPATPAASRHGDTAAARADAAAAIASSAAGAATIDCTITPTGLPDADELLIQPAAAASAYMCCARSSDPFFS